ncbi:hypothetical protein N7499_003481 [Penicillium canescens]|uniref:Myb-like domain-containing protein n=1 Tax=Penicillium canescens TaxID=5083 RepID=A0AAD6I8W1_PENCN|nr:uncharacterized protein N7446_012405 [Penicillium canescens]KAJ6038141.1 hypothetical protein N7460_007912 [Penicillium canescens]KAJ6045541.1 hypothetical protein N7446_012405 [Penicillium canescens]KAJ6090767.1 hypothetical protein N7499_003481 [Penicillium canescens]
MVPIDLDNIIHYHPPPIPKAPCKPLHLTTSHGSSHFPSNLPILIHPLPPRPPSLYHDSPRTPHRHRQSPSPVASCLPRDRDAHPNEFDKELANLEIAEFEGQETSGSCFGGSEESQSKDIDDVQGKELHDQRYVADRDHDHYREDLRLLSEDPATQQDTAASSNAAETGLLSAASAPTCPVEADGSVSPNEQCPVQDLSPTERNETQLSISGCEPKVNGVTAGNVSRDQTPSPNPSTSVPAGDEPEPANQRLFRGTPETGAESRKSSPLRVTEAHSTELHARDLSATRDSHLDVRSDGSDIHSTDCCPDDEALSRPISPVLHQKRQAVSRSEGKDSPGDLSRSCSVSVVVPVTRSRGPPKTRSTRAGSTRYTGKRENRANSPCNVDSDDPDDSDYTDGNDSGIGDIAVLPRLTKRPRRSAVTNIQPAQARRERPYRVLSSPAPEVEIANPCPGTSLQDIQTIPIRGFLTRQMFLSRVIYSCTFEEDRQLACPHEPTKAPTYEESLDRARHTPQSSNKKPSAHATRFLPAEDELLIELKEKQSLPWDRIMKHFPGRTRGALQVHYSTKLKDRGTRSLRRGRSGRVTCPATAAVASRG